MEEKLSGIVLNGVSFGESDKILNIFTLEKGTISAKIKGVKKAGAKLKFASEPFCFAEFVFSEVSGRRTVIGASLLESFYPLREDIVKYFAGGTVLEFLRRFAKESIVSKELFFLSIKTLKELCYTDKDSVYLLCAFLLNALSLSGYALNLNGCVCCEKTIKGKTFFDYNSGGFFCEECFEGQGREINPSTLSMLCKIASNEEVEEKPVKPLRLLDYYISNKAEENIVSLKELIKII